MVARLVIFLSIVGRVVVGLQASDFYVHDLPLLPKEASSIRMHAGQLPVNSPHHGALFFWHFAKKRASDKARTVIWLNGGPGCSSMIGAWIEIGPFRFQDADTIIENNGSWHLYTNLLFVDQPVGTGFSTTDADSLIHELDEMANQFLDFLDQYFAVFPELLGEDIYLAGDSFAGQYIPYVAQAILDNRSAMKLRGLLIGNGWIDPVTIYKSYLPFAVANNLVAENSTLYDRISTEVKRCEQALSNQVHVSEQACNSILNEITDNGAMNNHHGENQKGRCVNIYDIRLDDTMPYCGENWPPDYNYLTSYLHRQDVTSRIHIDGEKFSWTHCSPSVFNAFKPYYSKPSITLLPYLLHRIPIVLYSGEYDLICNHRATEDMLDGMTWNDGAGFDLGNGTSSPIDPWIVEGESAGLIRSARNLTYILFYGGSHMVPYNYAHRSRFMLHQFMQLNRTFLTDETASTNTEDLTPQTRPLGLSALTVVIIIVALAGPIWFFVYKRRPSRPFSSFSIIRVLRSKGRHVERQQWEAYSLLNDENEDLHVLDSETFV